MKRTGSILWGIVLIAVGVVFALNAFNITNINIFFNGWWTLFIIVPCIIGLFTDHEKTGSIIGILIGVCLLLACQNLLSFDILWKLVVTAIIILIGIKMIWKGIYGNKSTEILNKIKENGEEIKECCAVFSGQNIHFDNEVFTGVEITAVFGGVKCDLRNAVFEKDTVINACSVFGGIDILLPENVNLKINSNSLFGGISDKTRNGSKDNLYTVYLNGVCIFGGVDIK